ncbi:hypothetical protein NF867_18220 [Solitalea sp. MAHUQ-68]|uniref:Lipoprotein n=1 Tax=Solitalea agri TaxID=2953739 RepID=A0A9X2JFA7_9SPHI|nr:hypothetical protein [Solitalea agri]MCO4294805.1 hypothetical protein [Solitalea agri]
MTKFLTILFVSSLVLVSCKEDEPSVCDGLSQKDAEAYYNIAMQFSNNPTRANCNTLKSASYNLIKKFEKCDQATKDQIAQLTAAWDNVDCSYID